MFHIESNKSAGWYDLVVEAQKSAGYHFEESLECYLVLTLDLFTTNEKLASSVIAMDFLNALDESGRVLGSKLRDVGDQCLLLSGLFPECALQKNVSLDYFVGIGRNAYGLIANEELSRIPDPELFYKLSYHFIGLMDVLHVMRDISNIADHSES